jgi:hypothetical protein
VEVPARGTAGPGPEARKPAFRMTDGFRAHEGEGLVAEVEVREDSLAA